MNVYVLLIFDLQILELNYLKKKKNEGQGKAGLVNLKELNKNFQFFEKTILLSFDIGYG